MTPADPLLPAGTIPALVTPFRGPGVEVDLDAFERHLDWLAARGVAYVLVAGTTGEAPSLTVEERLALFDRAAAHGGELAFMAGTGANALPDTIDLSRGALERGAAAVLVAPPSYFPAGAEAVLAYYTALLEALPDNARVILYHIPPYTGVAIEPPVIDKLVQRFGTMVAGVKDSGGKPAYTRELVGAFPDLAVYTGSDGAIADAYRAGARGVISALANAVPQEVDAIRRAAVDSLASDAESRVLALRALSHAAPQRAAVKLLLHLLSGLPVCRVRPPELDLNAQQVEAIASDATVRYLQSEAVTPSRPASGAAGRA